jgi:hypothetical protein
VHLVIERWNKGDTTLPPNSPAVAPSIPTSVIAHQQPLDLSGVTLDAEGWSSWIEAPKGGWPGGVCPIPLAVPGKYEWRTQVVRSRRPEAVYPQKVGGWSATDGGNYPITAIRLKARSVSDTEGLPVGAVVRVWWGGISQPEIPRYSAHLGATWSWSTVVAAHPHATACGKEGWAYRPGAVYLPIDVRGA